MPDRRPIKQAHEKHYIDAFISWHNRTYRSHFYIDDRPDPPDAIIKSVWVTRWVEVADVYWNEAWARDLHSFATPGERHKPIAFGIKMGMDEQFATNFVAILIDKLAKNSYGPYANRYGQGYLILAMMSPFFNDTTIRYMHSKWAQTTVNNAGYFRAAFLAYGNPVRFKRWRLG